MLLAFILSFDCFSFFLVITFLYIFLRIFHISLEINGILDLNIPEASILLLIHDDLFSLKCSPTRLILYDRCQLLTFIGIVEVDVKSILLVRWVIFVRLRRDKIWARWVLTILVNCFIIIIIISESSKLTIRWLRGLFLIVILRYCGFWRNLSHLINSYNISQIWPSVTILEITPISSCMFHCSWFNLSGMHKSKKFYQES